MFDRLAASDRVENLPVLGMSPEPGFREEQLPVDDNLETPSA